MSEETTHNEEEAPDSEPEKQLRIRVSRRGLFRAGAATGLVGASNFPQNGGYNPTGTVGALAYHTADAIISKYLPKPGMLA